MKRITAILAILIVAVIVSNCSQSTQTVTLRFKYEPGSVLYYEQLSKSSGKWYVGDSLVSDRAHSYKVDIRQEALGFADDSTAEILESAEWEFIEPNKEDTTVLDTIQKSQEITFRLAPSGKIVSFEFTEQQDPSRYELLKNFYEQGLPVFPEGEKPVGYSWTQSTRVMLPDETMEASTTYEIKSLVRESGYDCAVIEYRGNLILPILASPKDTTQTHGLERIESSGVLYFAYKEGIVVLQKENWAIDGDIQRLHEGTMTKYKVVKDYSVTYALKKTEAVP